MFGGYRIMPRPCNSSSGEEGICMFNHECQNRRGEVLSTCMDGFLFGACCRLPPGVTLPPALPLPPSTARPTRPPTPPRPTPATPTPPPYPPSSGLLNPGLLTDTVLVYENGTVLNDTEIIPLEIFYPPSRHPPTPKPPHFASWSKRPPGTPPVTDPPNLPGAIEHIISMLDGQPPKAPSPTSFPPTRDPPPTGPARPPQTRPPPPTVIVLGPLHPHPLPHPDILPPYASMRPATTAKPAMQEEDDLKIDDETSEISPSDSQEGLVPPQPVPQPPTASTPTTASPTTTTTSEPSTTKSTTTARVPSRPPPTTTPIEGTTPIFEDPALHDKVSALVSNIVSSLAVDFHALQDVVLGENTTGGVRPIRPPSSTVSTTTRRPTRPPVEAVVAENAPEPTKPTGTRPQRPQGTRPTRPTSATPKPTRPPSGSGTPKPTRPTRPTRPPSSNSRPTKPTRPPSTLSTTKRPTRRPTKRPTTTTTPKPPPTEALIAEVEPPSTTAPPKRTTTTQAPTTTSTTTPTTAAPPATTTPERPVGDFRNECGVRPLMKTSGKKAGRIVGGKGSTFGEWPWQVLVRESTWLGLFTKNKCGGVLITTRYVMTAAHCQPGFLASLIAVFGEYDLTSELESRRAVTRNVRRVIVHRRYDAATFENDLALLELDSPVTYQQHIVPICMPKDGEEFTGRIATVTGWGRLRYGGGVPNVLQEVQVPVMENNVCQEMFRTAGHAKTILTSFVCAGYANGQKDSCEGDSGGPLMTERDDGRWVLIGTVSHGIKCAAPYLPGVYMRTTYYKPWLHSITGVE
ncbi:hypothetical protein J437_LFUL013132 [Ladona fulva]|uniref:Peptidase S1 domain-containing protein n=1 Tax=Ladona fulva TaxID=123851 RepID=A0A8K0P524_LADFU|nr:hypothetical protein J437_LFUL013132 [Ladona fulva]